MGCVSRNPYPKVVLIHVSSHLVGIIIADRDCTGFIMVLAATAPKYTW